MNPFSNRASDRRSSIPLQLVKDFVAHLNGIWEGTRLEATGSSVTLWIGTNLDCVLKSDSLIVKVRGDGSMILEESDRREFSVTGEIDLASMKVKLTRVIVSKSSDDDDESLSDVITYEGILHNPWDDDDHDDDDEILPTCMSLHDRTGAELSLECVTPNAPLPEYERTKKVPGMKPSLRSATSSSSSYGSFHFRDTATTSMEKEEEEKEEEEKEEKEEKEPSTPSAPTNHVVHPPTPTTSQKDIATVLLQREREYVNAARLRCKETGSTETTQRYLEAASMLSTARMILIQDEEKGAMFDPKRLEEVRKLVREGKAGGFATLDEPQLFI